jgi:hypothetical protein
MPAFANPAVAMPNHVERIQARFGQINGAALSRRVYWQLEPTRVR